MLLGIGIEPFEKLRSGCVFKFDGGDESENVIPIVFNQFRVDVKLRQQFIAESFVTFTFFKRIEAMFGKLFKPRREGKTEQMGDSEDDFGEAV